MYICSLNFKSLYNKFEKLQVNINDLENILNENIKITENLLKDPDFADIKSCLKSLDDLFKKSLVNLENIKLKIKQYKNNLDNRFLNYIKNTQECINDEDFFG